MRYAKVCSRPKNRATTLNKRILSGHPVHRMHNFELLNFRV